MRHPGPPPRRRVVPPRRRKLHPLDTGQLQDGNPSTPLERRLRSGARRRRIPAAPRLEDGQEEVTSSLHRQVAWIASSQGLEAEKRKGGMTDTNSSGSSPPQAAADASLLATNPPAASHPSHSVTLTEDDKPRPAAAQENQPQPQSQQSIAKPMTESEAFAIEREEGELSDDEAPECMPEAASHSGLCDTHVGECQPASHPPPSTQQHCDPALTVPPPPRTSSDDRRGTTSSSSSGKRCEPPPTTRQEGSKKKRRNTAAALSAGAAPAGDGAPAGIAINHLETCPWESGHFDEDGRDGGRGRGRGGVGAGGPLRSARFGWVYPPPCHQMDVDDLSNEQLRFLVAYTTARLLACFPAGTLTVKAIMRHLNRIANRLFRLTSRSVEARLTDVSTSCLGPLPTALAPLHRTVFEVCGPQHAPAGSGTSSSTSNTNSATISLTRRVSELDFAEWDSRRHLPAKYEGPKYLRGEGGGDDERARMMEEIQSWWVRMLGEYLRGRTERRPCSMDMAEQACPNPLPSSPSSAASPSALPALPALKHFVKSNPVCRERFTLSSGAGGRQFLRLADVALAPDSTAKEWLRQVGEYLQKTRRREWIGSLGHHFPRPAGLSKNNRLGQLILANRHLFTVDFDDKQSSFMVGLKGPRDQWDRLIDTENVRLNANPPPPPPAPSSTASSKEAQCSRAPGTKFPMPKILPIPVAVRERKGPPSPPPEPSRAEGEANEANDADEDMDVASLWAEGRRDDHHVPTIPAIPAIPPPVYPSPPLPPAPPAMGAIGASSPVHPMPMHPPSPRPSHGPPSLMPPSFDTGPMPPPPPPPMSLPAWPSSPGASMASAGVGSSFPFAIHGMPSPSHASAPAPAAAPMVPPLAAELVKAIVHPTQAAAGGGGVPAAGSSPAGGVQPDLLDALRLLVSANGVAGLGGGGVGGGGVTFGDHVGAGVGSNSNSSTSSGHGVPNAADAIQLLSSLIQSRLQQSVTPR
ncbi:unnamed protein product [Vitrella brassicaformis CCMP3155]|uniref:Uncharacterized protein n=1 Tax=Vitrella brassicaformis (strain CCMP3155) TaxID=1169540 RepID=A0A0G4GJC5_VITBC|nr:unnamed protein product [Vitrella brassicaformis CCMP3155]|eukprot:CEM29863.1 unnamed protein product [Vitrella brassicaformis CCMP3155]